MNKRPNNLFAWIVLLAWLLYAPVQVSASDKSDSLTIPKNWFLLDAETDKVLGLSVELAYKNLLKDKPSRTVIVAVIDSGVDIEHEDLRDKIWTNTKEIPGNGIDDDGNGYVDDVHGWNFIGGPGGNVNEDTYELTREYVRLRDKFEQADERKIAKKDRDEFAQWKKIRDDFFKLKEKNASQYNMFKQEYEKYRRVQIQISQCFKIIREHLDQEIITSEDLEGIESEDEVGLYAKMLLLRRSENVEEGEDMAPFLDELNAYMDYLEEAVDHYRVITEYGYNPDFDPRSIVGDNYQDVKERHYGNSDVKGPDSKHGTHVAGIIAAKRGNDIGIDGIADNVLIMPIRAVPNGDERDKDIANSIYYAVDNGAHIINMSFGKSYSPQKDAVDKAVKYAEKKGVLLVHAAGNDGRNNDERPSFPNRYYAGGGEAANWLEVGATSWSADLEFLASFTNYGKNSVDVFAPGVDIYSTTPENEYQSQNGTSMASPAAAGVAALIMSYFPDLSAAEVREILKESTRKFDGVKVFKPGTQDITELKQLSRTGGLINAYEAVKMAEERSKKRVE
ncbi:MAG TPA: S8 family peptidase [Cyclobacteriaceae bacterium]|nr:S8 family peptidase [Cyclobacteriaceae bacterium]